MNVRHIVIALGLLIVGCDKPMQPDTADDDNTVGDNRFGPDAGRSGIDQPTTASGRAGSPSTATGTGGATGSTGMGGDDTSLAATYTPMVDPTASSPKPADHLVAVVNGTADYPNLRGTVHFMPSGEFVEVRTEVTGLPAGKHGYHVHVYGDCSDPKNKSAGDHLDFAALGGGFGRTGSYGSPGTGSTGMGDADRNMGPGTTGTTTPTEGSPTGPGGVATTTGTSSTGATGGTTTTGTGATGTGTGTTGTQTGATGTGSPTGAESTAGTGTEMIPSTGGPGTFAGQDHTRSRITGNLGDIEGMRGKAASANARIMLPANQIGMLTGRSVQIHELPNDESKAPDGGTGDAIACGVIGVANEAMQLPTPARVESTPGQPTDQPKDQKPGDQPGDQSDEQQPEDLEDPLSPTPAPR